ncbi:MAG: endonuclease domain-containing protein [Allosphingosinicella sp.]
MSGRRVPLRHTQQARTLRREATPQERMLWNLLSRYRPKFTRQLPIGPYTADFANREARLVVEVDGSQHIDSAADRVRTAFLAAEGWTVIRFWNSEVDENPDGVAEAILLRTAECLGGLVPEPRPSRAGRKRHPRIR